MPRRVAASALAVALAVAVHLSLAPSPIAHSAPAQNTPTQATEVGIQIELVEEKACVVVEPPDVGAALGDGTDRTHAGCARGKGAAFGLAKLYPTP